MLLDFLPNKGKRRYIDTEFGMFARYPVKTHVVVSGDSLPDMMDKYLKEYLEKGDYIFISEKIVAISQGRAFPVTEIKPSRMAKILAKFVHKSPHGIGLGMPETMELAIRELGLLRIMFAAFCSAITKIFGVRGVFYNILGEKARAIDGPTHNTLPPYNKYAKLAPDRPNQVAAELAAHTGHKVVIIDANDLGVEVLGRSEESIPIQFCKQVFLDNPLAQSSQQTPLCIVREADRDAAVEPEQPAEEESVATPEDGKEKHLPPETADGDPKDFAEGTWQDAESTIPVPNQEDMAGDELEEDDDLNEDLDDSDK